MKHYLLIPIFLFLISSVSYTQSVEDEANPQKTITEDNSEYTILWRAMLDARKNNDLTLYNQLSAEIQQKFPGKYTGRNAGSDNIFHLTPAGGGMMGDWINGDLLLHNGILAAPGTGNPNPVRRNLKIEADSLGNLFAAFINSTRDSLHIFRSTNQGNGWGRITSIVLTGTFRLQAFDMFITDSTAKHKIGFAASIYDNAAGQYSSTLYWLELFTDATGFSTTVIQSTGSGYGYVSPAIVSDGYLYSPGSTYWYIAYQRVNTGTGAGNQALLAMSTNWGNTWVIDTARNTYNDYDLDVDYSFDADSIYVLLTNNLTAANENLRLRYTALGNIGTGIAWEQYNPASTSAPEREGSMSSNRNTNAIIITYTIVESGNENVNYAFSSTGSTGNFVTGTVWASPITDNRSSVEYQESQGAIRMSYVTSTAGQDTVIYSGTFQPPFSTRQVVNQNNASNTLAPDIVGYRAGASLFGGGVLFAGAGNNGAWFDGSNTVVGIDPVNNKIPSTFKLEQNYPNPFNPSTTIKFSIIEPSSKTSLVIYDVLGKEISTLVNETLQPGEYEITWNAFSLPSGIYFYKLTSGSSSDIKKMTLVK